MRHVTADLFSFPCLRVAFHCHLLCPVFIIMRSESHSKARTRHGDPLHLGSPRKKAKVHHSFTDALPWKTVVRPSEAGMGGDDGILELEEVDGVEVVYEEMPHGQVVRFNVRTSYFEKNIILSSL